VEGLGLRFRDWGSVFGVWGLGFKDQGVRLRFAIYTYLNTNFP